ncbi:hypothetical protein [Lacicoccus alkaliphilus]|uniref:Uncharacterized protein n=1 Tax=Lacicoccus alkaliphilus DSM 16010 TaxID=1123231 RepID=A0A1M7AJ91_9BACL|nr:hypothetical protein [Salinicoccus alkaliphilus]SHL42788.1 hypothetical protein SAMN02745189_00173 [Salinicoccus alkaliphilus DSM 16010]
MVMRILLYAGLGLLSIYLLNYFEIANVEFTFVNMLIAVGGIVLLRILYSLFIRLLRVFVFAFVFLPLIGLLVYYLYSYFTGQSVDLVLW